MLTFIDQSLVLLAWEQVLINIGASHLHPREKVVKLDKCLSLSTLNKRTNLRTHCRQNLFFGNNRIYNIAGKFVYPNSIARACFIFQLCALMTSANKSLEEKNFPSCWKCYKTIGSYVSCAFINIWSTWEVWKALEKLELLSATPRATLTHLSCSPNFPRASYLDERTLTNEPIVKYRLNKQGGVKVVDHLSYKLIRSNLDGIWKLWHF